MATWTELSKYKHHAVRSDGAKFLDGERNDALDTSWLTVNSSGRVTLGPGLYDELLVVKGEVSDEQIKAWASMGAPFYDPTPVIPDSQIPSAGEWSSKNKTFFQTDPPVGAVVGDLWVDTDDNDRLYRWDGATWVDITDKSPVDAEKKPVYVKGAGADIDIDKYGIRATRKTDGKKTFEIDAETGDARFAGDISGSSGTFADGRVAIGDIGGKPWGDSALPAGTAGIWGDQAGLYLRGYARLLTAGSAFDEDVIDLSDFPNVNQPEILVAPKELVTINPPEGATSNLYVDAIKLPDGNFRVKAKAIVKGKPISWGGRSETADSWSFVRPTASVGGKKGVFTDFFICRPVWRVSSGGLGLYTARLWMDITDQFNANGDPINWQTIRTFSRSSAGSGTLNWDTALPHYGQWALRVRGEGGGALLIKYAFTALQDSGYRTGDNYYDVDGELIEAADPANQPSKMSVIYFVFDRG